MSNPRDEQFKGFALAALGTMLKAAEPHTHGDAVDLGSEEAQHAMLQALARAAYDLVEHVVGSINPIAYQAGDCEEIVTSIPDMPVLPEETNE